MGAMVRRLLTPRWLAAHLLTILLVVSFAWLGHWQLDRAAEFRQSASDASEPAPVPLGSLTQVRGSLPATAMGRLVTLTGSYDAAHTYLVPGHVQGGTQGLWILSVLRLPAGPGVLVVRGWVPSASGVVPPESGPVEVTGRLSASDDPGGGLPPGTTLPVGEVAAANPVDLLSLVPYPLYDGYVTLRTQVPQPPAGLAVVPSPRVGNNVPGFYLPHLAYVALWWLFAAFALFFWFRLVRDEGGPPGEAPTSQG
jgi:cytochrome oxidase assembly protein ShyY1